MLVTTFLISGYGCDNLKEWFNGDVNLGVDWSWNDGGGKWTAREDSMVVLKRDEEIINLTGVSGDAVVPIVLGLVLDKVTVVQPNRPRGWTYNSLTNNEWKQVEKGELDKWKVVDEKGKDSKCFDKTERGKIRKIKKDCLNDRNRLNTLQKRVMELKLTYSYKLKQ